MYDYHNGDFDGLRGALEALNICNLTKDSDDIRGTTTVPTRDATVSAVCGRFIKRC